jgi:hypothetical protein
LPGRLACTGHDVGTRKLEAGTANVKGTRQRLPAARCPLRPTVGGGAVGNAVTQSVRYQCGWTGTEASLVPEAFDEAVGRVADGRSARAVDTG